MRQATSILSAFVLGLSLSIASVGRAEAQKRISETMSSISEKSAFEAFARILIVGCDPRQAVV